MIYKIRKISNILDHGFHIECAIIKRRYLNNVSCSPASAWNLSRNISSMQSFNSSNKLKSSYMEKTSSDPTRIDALDKLTPSRKALLYHITRKFKIDERKILKILEKPSLNELEEIPDDLIIVLKNFLTDSRHKDCLRSRSDREEEYKRKVVDTARACGLEVPK